MAQGARIQDDLQVPTLVTSFIPTAQQTPEIVSQGDIEWRVGGGGGEWSRHGHGARWQEQRREAFRIRDLGSTGKGILIGMLSAFGSAALVALIIAIVYFFRYTNRGRIFLDRIGRPGEFDDEQQFLRDEEAAMAEMDELQRAEYLRAKGRIG